MPFTASDKLRRPLTGAGAGAGNGGTVRINDGIMDDDIVDIGNGAAPLGPVATAAAIANAFGPGIGDGIGFVSKGPLPSPCTVAALASRWWRWRTVRCAKAPDLA